MAVTEAHVPSLLTQRPARRHSDDSPSPESLLPEPFTASGLYRLSVQPRCQYLQVWRQRQTSLLGTTLAGQRAPAPASQSAAKAAVKPYARVFSGAAGRAASPSAGQAARTAPPPLGFTLLQDPAALVEELMAPHRLLLQTHGVRVPGASLESAQLAASRPLDPRQLGVLRDSLAGEVRAMEKQCRDGLPSPLADLYKRWIRAIEPLIDEVDMAQALRAARSPGLGSPTASALR